MSSYKLCQISCVLVLLCFGSCQSSKEFVPSKIESPEIGFQMFSPATSTQTGWQGNKLVTGLPDRRELTTIDDGEIFYTSVNGAAIKIPAKAHFDLRFDFQFGKGGSLSIDLPSVNDHIALNDNWDNSSTPFVSIGSSNLAISMEHLCLAPGLWQSFDIKVRADSILTFKVNGKAISLNAMGIERSSDTLLISNAAGEVAIKNLFTKNYSDTPDLSLGQLSYKYYEGHFKKMPDFKSMEPLDSGEANYLELDAVKNRNEHFAVQFSSQLEVKQTGTYKLKLLSDDGIEVRIDGIEVLSNGGAKDFRVKEFEVDLDSGSYTFELDYYQQVWGAYIGLIYIGPNSDETYLGRKNKQVPKDAGPPILVIDPETSRARMQRGFFNFEGEKLTEVIAVALPNQMNYAINLSNGALLGVWKGGFLDVGEMWINRGEAQLMKPQEACQYLQNESIIANLDYQGYQLDEDGIPSFNFDSDGQEFALLYKSQGEHLIGTLSFANDSSLAISKAGVIDLGESGYRTNKHQTVFFKDISTQTNSYIYEIIW